MFNNFYSETVSKLVRLGFSEDDIDHVQYKLGSETRSTAWRVFKQNIMMFYDNNVKIVSEEPQFEIDPNLKVFLKNGSYLFRVYHDGIEEWEFKKY